MRILGDRYHEMLMIIEGDLPEPVVTSLVARVRVLLESSDRKVEDVQEC